MKELHRQHHGDLTDGDLFGMVDELQVLAVRWVRDDVGDLDNSPEEILPLP